MKVERSLKIIYSVGNIICGKYTDKICLHYESLQTEICKKDPEIFLNDEIWALILLSLKVGR